jgi:hypothetical protein
MLARGYISGITTVAKLLLVAYIITLGVPARQPSTLGEPREYTIEEYEEAARIICERISRFSPPEIYSPSLAVSAAMDYANGTLGVDMTEAPRVKRTAAPAFLTEMGIVAYYAFPTSEIVINTSAPDFMAVLSSAHEAMHLFGISREDEANFFAVLALISSGDQALSFCAHLCAFVYVGAHICVQNRDTYSEIYDRLPDFAKEMLKKRTQFLQGKGSITGPVSDALNDAAISLRDSRGADSYSQSAALLVSYFLE